MNMTLHPFHEKQTFDLSVEADQDFLIELWGYQDYYHNTYGVTVSVEQILRETAQQFMANDQEFQNFKRRRGAD